MKSWRDVTLHLKGFFKRNHPLWLRNLGAGEPFEGFPHSVGLGRPTDLEALADTEGARAWIASWRNLPRDLGEVSWAERNWRNLGRQNIPVSLSIPDPLTVSRWLGEEGAWEEARGRYLSAIEMFPGLAFTLPDCHRELFGLGGPDFRRLMGMLAWLRDNPGSGLFPREIPLAGLDSKWLEQRRGSVSALAPSILGVEARGRGFYQALGLRDPPRLVRLRALDPRLRASLGAWRDLSVPLEELGGKRPRPRLAIIVENLQTGLSMGDIPGALLFLGLGKGVSLLGEIPWLRGLPGLYWGDIDTHGLAILGMARQALPGLESILMDSRTLLAHRDLWVVDKPYAGADPPGLGQEELSLFRDLRSNRYGKDVRLEQERISWGHAWPLIRDRAEQLA